MSFVRFTKSPHPGELKIDAFRLGMLNELRKIGTQIKLDFERPTKTWTHKVSFYKRPSLSGNRPAIEVGTENEIYVNLDQGVAGKEIVPIGTKVLRFPRTFAAKTLPGTLQARAGIRTDYIYRPAATWKGIEARNFVDSVSAIWKPKIAQELQQALDRVAERTGFAST